MNSRNSNPKIKIKQKEVVTTVVAKAKDTETKDIGLLVYNTKALIKST